ncbi:cobalamin/Fe(3+)-siderophore ABC transporter ATP-binding protein [Nocardioides gansuensis]|uniref:Cobalamin/Fe(3+)-siderophore ABC transporter ATP-binding protein n=1 Tax=Nocardioides gansuensis TaxID=2138300 RepID=A0A2T8F5G8_9ACTN|nr:ABC transporter ATP-binding protein [Nocardioides gansuensis]PVG80932.1 cobalamin/Fe(3+)-siderophore ABC transporter ATP-binding protein [Nocardioides gansuensis]
MLVTDLTLGYDGPDVVHSVDLAVERGTLTVVVGPNGCGKSTLLRGMARLLRPRSGRVTLDGADVAGMSGRELARLVGVLPQAPTTPRGLTVAELVGRGRFPHREWYQRWSGRDEEAVQRAIAQVDLADRHDHPVDSLSGGQRQRAWLAMVLAQETDHLMLDEPTTYLDLAHAVEVMALARSIAHDGGRTVVCVLHDLTLAARYADRLVVVREGTIAAAGAPAAVLSEQLLDDVFGLRAKVLDVDGAPAVVPVV